MDATTTSREGNAKSCCGSSAADDKANASITARPTPPTSAKSESGSCCGSTAKVAEAAEPVSHKSCCGSKGNQATAVAAAPAPLKAGASCCATKSQAAATSAADSLRAAGTGHSCCGTSDKDDFTKRLWIGLAFTMPLLIISMGPMLGLPIRAWLGETALTRGAAPWLELLLATPVVLWCGRPFFERGWQSIKSGQYNMWTLIALGTGVAFAYSCIATIAPGIFPAGFQLAGGKVAVYFEAAAVIILLVLVGQLMELSAVGKTGSAIRALLDLAPKTALRLTDGGADETVPLDAVQVGDFLRVRPGEAIPVDGTVTEGKSAVDESLVTGEAIPVEKTAGASVIGGTINKSGSFVMRAEHVGSETQLSRIVAMVAEAQNSRAPIQRLADVAAGYFVPAVVAAALVAFIAWVAVGPAPAYAYGIVAAVSVLIVACPCVLGLATPMSITVATGRGAQAGVLARNAESLERLADVDTLVIDKTGTLTLGRPQLTGWKAAPSCEARQDNQGNEVLALAASIERGSEHPLAEAILQGAAENKVELRPVEDFAAITGRGVTGVIDGARLALGNSAMMDDLSVDVSALEQNLAAWQSEGKTAVYLAQDGKLAGVLAVSDPIKDGAAAQIEALHREGLRIVMATGDNRATATAVATELGIDEVHAEVLPGDKARIVADLQRMGAKVAMAGDGVNDAPALTQADVGIAMGTGADVAIESAGITLVKGDLSGILRARRLSKATMRNIKQNLMFAFGYNALAIPIAGGLFYPLFGWLLSPAIAAAAMSLSSVSVISNALRLRGVKL